MMTSDGGQHQSHRGVFGVTVAHKGPGRVGGHVDSQRKEGHRDAPQGAPPG